MKYFTVAVFILCTSLYTKSAASAAPPTQLPCQKTSILGKPHELCWTVDDHPTRHTPGVLKVLRKYKIRATFFVVGWPLGYAIHHPKSKNARKYLRWFRQILKDKHVIGNHSVTHANLCKISKARVRRELTRTQKYIKQLGGGTPTMWRAPSMALCKQDIREARRLKLTHVSCDVADYKRSARSMWRKLRRRVQRGKKYSIILVHMNARKLRKFLRLIKKHP